MKKTTGLATAALVLGLMAFSQGEPNSMDGVSEITGRAANTPISGTVRIDGSSISLRFQYTSRRHRRTPEVTLRGTLNGTRATFTTVGTVGMEVGTKVGVAAWCTSLTAAPRPPKAC